MATFTVNTTEDIVDGNYSQLSLREAVNLANATSAADTIEFAGSLSGATLTLTNGELTLQRDVSINGDQEGDGVGVTIDANFSSRLIKVDGDINVEIDNLTLANGRSDSDGGAICISLGNLAMSNSTVSHSSARLGGGIYVGYSSRIDMVDSKILHNESQQRGGGIDTGTDAEVLVRRSEISHNEAGNFGAGGGIFVVGSLVMEDSLVTHNIAAGSPSEGGAISILHGSTQIARSTISNNAVLSGPGGGISIYNSDLVIFDSTVAANYARRDFDALGGGIFAGLQSDLTVVNCTITDNRMISDYAGASGGGIGLFQESKLSIANSIVSGNLALSLNSSGADIGGGISITNGHNIFGSDVIGNNPGDRENIAASAVFANIDPETGGGLISGRVVPLLNSTSNPALSGADPLAASATGQNGTSARPQPAGSQPDIGSIEINQPLSTAATANNDVRTGNSAANKLNGDLGNDYLKGLGGKDTLNGGDGSDLLDGGTGNDKLNGGGGIDLVFFGGATKVTFDLAATTDTAKRGSETDTLTGLEGAIGSSATDVFKGNEFNNYFQGGNGKDTFSGGNGRDLYDVNAVAESGVGTTKRDVISDFAHLVDDIDLMGIDANTTVTGNQAFLWVGTSALTGAGQLGYFTSGTTTIIHGSNDADATDEFQIQLTGIKSLTVDDFYL